MNQFIYGGGELRSNVRTAIEANHAQFNVFAKTVLTKSYLNYNKENIANVITKMRKMNGEVIEPPTLTGLHVEWVKERIEARYDRTRLVNAPLLEVDGVPSFPDKEAALKSALKQLTREQLAYMMEEGRAPFMFQMKLVGPSKKGIDLQRTLVDGQPKRMGTPKQGQEEMFVWEGAERHLASKLAGKTEWKWEFVQGEQIIEPQKEDDLTLLVEDRVKRVKRSRPKGMRGTDRYTLATLMADGLEAGKPLDIRFKGDSMNTEEYEVWNATLMDEEGELTEGGNRFLVRGNFDPDRRKARLNRYYANLRNDDARIRSSVDGSIEA